MEDQNENDAIFKNQSVNVGDEKEGNVHNRRTESYEDQCWKPRVCYVLRNVTVEPVVLLYTIAMAISGITTQSLIIRKYCLNQLNYSIEICENLTSNKNLEEQAQALATDFIFYKTILETLPTVFLSFFLGTWSDKNGRKLLLLIPNIGGGINMILMILCAYYVTQLDVNYMLVASLAYALGGNTLSVMTGAISYIADITDPKQRTARFGFIQAAYLCGLPIGVSSGGYIFQYFGYITVYVVSVVLYLLTIIYLWFIRETVQPNTSGPSYISIFSMQNVKENLETLCKKREHNGRFHLLLIMIGAAISFLPLYAEYNITYLYVRWKFQWDEVMYSNYSTCVFIACFIGLSLVMPCLSLRLKMKDLVIGFLSAMCKVTTELILAISTRGWMLFAATPLAVISGMNSTALRTVMSKIVSPEEQGKITSVMSAAEAGTVTIGSIMFTQVYNATRLNFPGAIFIMSASLALIPAICFAWIHIERRNVGENSRYESA